MKSARKTSTFMYIGGTASQNLATEVHAGGKGRVSVWAKKITAASSGYLWGNKTDMD